MNKLSAINESSTRYLDKTMPFVSIIMPNFNGGDFVIKAIESILNLDYPDDRFELVIIDNGSSDNSRQDIKREFTSRFNSNKLRLIGLDSNVGAPAALNTGINNANKDYDYILKLDNDIILERNSLIELVRCGESSSLIGMIGGKVFYFSDKRRLHLIGSRLSPFYGGALGIGKYKLDNNQYNKNLELDGVNGCMMLVKRELIDRVGLMDEKYFLYFDDIDWGLRAMRSGFKSVYCHNAVAYHNTSLPHKRFQNKNWLYYAIYNSFYFMKKNYSGFNRFIFFIATNMRILYYILGVLVNNNIFRQKELLKTIFSAYGNGIVCLGKKE